MSIENENCGLYIHIPFCRRRCDYCNFFFILNTGLKEQFISALIKEMELYSRLYPEKIFDSIYFGGGTPSILEPSEIEKISNALHSNFIINELREVTLECNPEDLDEEKISGYSNAGVNRLSLGTQSFTDGELQFLTREHTVKQAIEVVELTAKHFSNYTIDLIYSIPGQSKMSLKENLNAVSKISPPHISAYTLTFEKNTPLYKKLERNEVIKNPESIESELYLYLSEYLTNLDYDHYEVSSFAKENFNAYHNSKYWKGVEYLGLGPSAHSFMNDQRYNNVLSVKKYCEELNQFSLPVENRVTLSGKQLLEEKIMLQLRSSGMNNDELKNYLKPESKKILDGLIGTGKAKLTYGTFKLTPAGYLIADEIAARLNGMLIEE